MYRTGSPWWVQWVFGKTASQPDCQMILLFNIFTIFIIFMTNCNFFKLNKHHTCTLWQIKMESQNDVSLSINHQMFSSGNRVQWCCNKRAALLTSKWIKCQLSPVTQPKSWKRPQTRFYHKCVLNSFDSCLINTAYIWLKFQFDLKACNPTLTVSLEWYLYRLLCSEINTFSSLPFFMVSSSAPSEREGVQKTTGCVLCAASRPVLAVVLVLTLDQAQFALQTLAVGRQVAVVLQQLAVLLDESGWSLLLPLVLLQLRQQLMSEHREQHRAPVTACTAWTLFTWIGI